MTEKRDVCIYLEDMLPATEKALSFIEGMDYSSFEKNDEKIFAVTRALEIIGEATKHIPASVRGKYPDVPWRQITGLRDKLSHAYFDVHIYPLWLTITNDLPKLRVTLINMIWDYKRDK